MHGNRLDALDGVDRRMTGEEACSLLALYAGLDLLPPRGLLWTVLTLLERFVSPILEGWLLEDK